MTITENAYHIQTKNLTNMKVFVYDEQEPAIQLPAT